MTHPIKISVPQIPRSLSNSGDCTEAKEFKLIAPGDYIGILEELHDLKESVTGRGFLTTLRINIDDKKVFMSLGGSLPTIQFIRECWPFIKDKKVKIRVTVYNPDGTREYNRVMFRGFDDVVPKE